MSDAFWTSLFSCIASSIAVWVARRGNAISRENKRVLREVHDKVNGNLERAVAKAEDDARRRTSPRVLLVDDDSNDIELASLPLRKFGCDIFTARSAGEAEKQLLANIGPGRGYPFDFVLVDLRMPRGESDVVFETFQRLAPRVPLVILSGMAMGVFPPMVTSGVLRWIQKPLDESHVQILLDQFNVPYKRPRSTSRSQHPPKQTNT